MKQGIFSWNISDDTSGFREYRYRVMRDDGTSAHWLPWSDYSAQPSGTVTLGPWFKWRVEVEARDNVGNYSILKSSAEEITGLSLYLLRNPQDITVRARPEDFNEPLYYELLLMAVADWNNALAQHNIDWVRFRIVTTESANVIVEEVFYPEKDWEGYCLPEANHGLVDSRTIELNHPRIEQNGDFAEPYIRVLSIISHELGHALGIREPYYFPEKCPLCGGAWQEPDYCYQCQYGRDWIEDPTFPGVMNYHTGHRAVYHEIKYNQPTAADIELVLRLFPSKWHGN